MLTILDGGEPVAHVSAEFLTSPPRYDLPSEEPAYLARGAWTVIPEIDSGSSPGPNPKSGRDAIGRCSSPPAGLAQPVQQALGLGSSMTDMVQTNTVVGPGADAAVLRDQGGEPGASR